MKLSYKWNADDYRKNSTAQQRWAQELISKLSLAGNESILDIGCGDGKVTFELSLQVPEGNVLGIDASPDMISLARRTYPPRRFQNLTFQLKDARELDFTEKFHLVFSNATLHWITDHRPVLEGIRRSLRPGGRILLQMGGQGNALGLFKPLEQVMERATWNKYFTDFTFPYGFYGPEEYSIWLEDAGLKAKRIELIPKDKIHSDKEDLAGWVRTTWLPYTQRVPENLREAFIDEVVEKYIEENPSSDGLIHVQIVRLEVEALFS
jgi:trans-aconitate 2-methyltransferase